MGEHHRAPTGVLEVQPLVDLREPMTRLALRRYRHVHAGAAALPAPVDHRVDEPPGETATAMCWNDVKVADLGKAPPLDVEHGRSRDDAQRLSFLDRHGGPAGVVSQHTIEILPGSM